MADEKETTLVEVRLTRTEEALYDNWTADFKSVMAGIAALVNDNMAMRLRDIAADHGIDLNKDDWTFDHATKSFKKEDNKK